MKQPLFSASSAEFDPSQQYRYTLTRGWPDWDDKNTRRLFFIMLNPSTATAEENDPTVRRCMGYAYDWGYRQLTVLNIFALRSTDPSALYTHPDPVGPDNNKIIEREIKDAKKVTKLDPLIICAWGTHGDLNGRGEDVVMLLKDIKAIPYCFKTTKGGQPQHPLYLAADLRPYPYSYPVFPKVY